MTLPRPLSRAEGRDQIEELSALARTDKGLHQYCADFKDWGPIAVQRFFVWRITVPIGTLQAFHLAVAAWLITVLHPRRNVLRPIERTFPLDARSRSRRRRRSGSSAARPTGREAQARMARLTRGAAHTQKEGGGRATLALH